MLPPPTPEHLETVRRYGPLVAVRGNVDTRLRRLAEGPTRSSALAVTFLAIPQGLAAQPAFQDADGRPMDAEAVAGFLSRSLFCMFAEDSKLLRDQMFTKMLLAVRAGSSVKLTEKDLAEIDAVLSQANELDGDVYALQDRCSHQDFPLSDGELEGTKLECIYHGAKFDVASGRAVALPAIRPVKTYPVKVEGTDVLVELE